MTDLRQAAQQALEALEGADAVDTDMQAAITALKNALEQQAEPPPEWPLVKNILDEYGLDAISFVAEFKAAQRTCVGLTDEEISEIRLKTFDAVATNYEVYRAIEAALKEKNSA